ncbi:MAG: hypothetical protein SGPRY_010761 [Prymnesium sp.]
MAALRGNLQAFLAGSVSTLAFGYYRLHQDVWRAAEQVDERIKAVGEEAVATHVALQARVDALEDELKKLRAAPKADS